MHIAKQIFGVAVLIIRKVPRISLLSVSIVDCRIIINKNLHNTAENRPKGRPLGGTGNSEAAKSSTGAQDARDTVVATRWLIRENLLQFESLVVTIRLT